MRTSYIKHICIKYGINVYNGPLIMSTFYRWNLISLSVRSNSFIDGSDCVHCLSTEEAKQVIIYMYFIMKNEKHYLFYADCLITASSIFCSMKYNFREYFPKFDCKTSVSNVNLVHLKGIGFFFHRVGGFFFVLFGFYYFIFCCFCQNNISKQYVKYFNCQK